MVKRIVYGKYKDFYHKEIECLMGLHHPFIIKLYEWFEDNERIYLVQELCRYGDLYHEINLRKKERYLWQEKEIANIMVQLFYALNYLHENNIVHRDIKPENIMFFDRAKTKIRLIDFGSAAKLHWKEKFMLKEQFGSPYYIAPEVLNKHYN